MSGKQIFQTETKRRWHTFTWVSRGFFLVFIAAIVCVAFTLWSVQSPRLPFINTNTPLTQKQLEKLKKSQQYKDFTIAKSKLQKIKKDREKRVLLHRGDSKRINMAFYVNWAGTAGKSLADLKRNIGHLDMVATESFFLNGDSIVDKADTAALHVIHQAHKSPIAVVSNFNQDHWDGAAVRRLLNDLPAQQKLITNLIRVTKKYHFQGINIDFEELNLENRDQFNAFMKNLYEQFHAKKLMVSQDISPENDDYNPAILQNYNDYVVLMAYDQHTDQSNAGDISHQEWVEDKLDDICSEMNPDKVILALACYGYDWPQNSVGKSITYEDAMNTAVNYKSQIHYNPQSANLNYTYKDGSNITHEVYFTDAATNFNLIRKADDWNIAGVALWRLGSEDKRLWSFISNDLSLDALKKKPVDLRKISPLTMGGIAYIGDGEILDLVSTPNPGSVKFTLDKKNFSIADQKYVRLPTQYVIKRFGEADKKIALTFDDGPDPTYTPQVINILKKENVPGCFFVVGIMAEKNMELLRQEYNDGYEIGNHTFFHPDMSAIGPNRVKFELNSTRRLIEAVTGHSTILFRAPFNADAEPQNISEILPVAQSRKENYINIGEYIDPEDWEPGKTADQIFNEVVKQQDNGNILLLHDAGGNREATVAALPRIIKFFKQKGYTFTTVGDLMGKKRAELMPAVKSTANSGFTGSGDLFFINFFYYGNMILNIIFTVAIVLAILRTLFIAYLALLQRKKAKKNVHNLIKSPAEKVSIIIPAYNEEITAVQTIKSLLKTNYPDFELIFVDDGSKDETYAMVNAQFGNHPQVKVFRKANGGKASALNYGIAQATADYIICIDADTQLKNNAVTELMRYFYQPQIAAVAGTVKVGNANNILTKWQSIEYITAQNMDRRAFDLLNTITVVPGAIGAFRKEVVIEVGGFTTDTLAEDCDLTMRILRAGYTVKNCDNAVAYTEAPETVNMLLKQRFRWSFGVMQSFWKNRKTLLNKKYGYFGMVGMPNILIYQIILPLFSPLADLFMLISLISGLFSLSAINNLKLTGLSGILSLHNGFGQVLFYYIIFILVDLFFAAIAFKMEKEKLKSLIYLLPQRFFWRQLMYLVLFRSFRKAIKGELETWGTLKRTGNVKEVVALS
ncbi:glycosyltransferase [Pedobacter rhizosphaerae]|uniref:Glycosyltransferase, catalytic subunit of cellulose synthase and poly-beta-1,6-N-acetylglucosamine synthase n=1 Tax=Pedobacter rhizosphaerae TaxID=390241 RepID=A0A1H9TCQ2_9SPHI|nr:glycosyltransferase [Pedobacter rhizosphaerae]SER94393.1 Glycosyltransferase, catalytic subunit of cellulose synthase and poly-beta-1,6-N-acetylglucosamine synthase [Pedobacter rhizosphaerae]